MHIKQTLDIFFLKDYQKSKIDNLFFQKDKTDNSVSPKFNILLSIRHCQFPNVQNITRNFSNRSNKTGKQVHDLHKISTTPFSIAQKQS